jgi:phosphopantetheinyl transferase
VGILSNRIVELGSQIGLWEVTEDYEALFRTVHLNDYDIRRLNTFKSLNRKVESLSVRALLQQMTRPDARIVYQKRSHKPYLDDNSANISITHSHNYTAILLNKTRQVGIDIEYISHKIERVAHKFINDDEQITDDPKLRRNHLYIHWCAKEALYKISSRGKDINFKDSMTIKPFDYDTQGDIIGIVKNGSQYEEYNMYYTIENNYALVYCTK